MAVLHSHVVRTYRPHYKISGKVWVKSSTLYLAVFDNSPNVSTTDLFDQALDIVAPFKLCDFQGFVASAERNSGVFLRSYAVKCDNSHVFRFTAFRKRLEDFTDASLLSTFARCKAAMLQSLEDDFVGGRSTDFKIGNTDNLMHVKVRNTIMLP